jgi:very-short-patch-repair endonuclease
MANGGKLDWWRLVPREIAKRKQILRTVRISGRPCHADLEQIQDIYDALMVRIGFEKMWGFWACRCEKIAGPYTLQLQALKSFCAAIDAAFSLEILIGQCRNSLNDVSSPSEPNWADESQVEQFIASCRLAIAGIEKRRAIEEIGKIETPAALFVARSRAHPVSRDLLEAIRGRDVDAFNSAFAKIQYLKKERSHVQKVDEYLKHLHQCAPRLTQDLERTYENDQWDSRVHQIRDAWYWAQARAYIGEYLNREDAPSLSIRSNQIEDEINVNIAQIASLRAWSFCFSRLNVDHRSHMVAWQQSMRRLGKGTGKHAPRHRREAQQHLNKCREAVPAWVMPLHRVWDTVDPAPGLFDVIIVDEASQCGFEALPLFYLGKKILIVGDDKQISPDAVGLPGDSVHRLMEEYLYDFSFRSSFYVEGSLFDHGKLRYGTNQVTLREHFRCMPEIIRFSNDLCYSDTPLIPLRQYGTDRLVPLEHVFVESGYREGFNSLVINRPEADAIVNKIAEMCCDPKYTKKTMGVVVLQGDAQGGLIEEALLNRLGAEEMERRRLICGNPYSFQGDERDIIFLSMVAAPNERIGPLTKAADERRFNVAASRARDQMYLFHSVKRDDLSTSCLRRILLEFFESTRPQEIGGIILEDLERQASRENRIIVKPPHPFDSWFEVDVALQLLRKDFYVMPQYAVAAKRIDLVIEGGCARLAVECDGDEWHGVDRYEADMQRQRILERCGWVFFRIRASEFYANKEKALKGLWQMLEDRQIYPGSAVSK